MNNFQIDKREIFQSTQASTSHDLKISNESMKVYICLILQTSLLRLSPTLRLFCVMSGPI